MGALSRIFSLSTLATVITVGYVGLAMSNLYRLMYPLHGVDLANFAPSQLVRPLWGGGGAGLGGGGTIAPPTPLSMKIYLSTTERFGLEFLRAEYDDETGGGGGRAVKDDSVVLLWEEEDDDERDDDAVSNNARTAASVAKSFVITDGCDGSPTHACSGAPSFEKASEFLNDAEEKHELETGGTGGGLVHTLSSHAGEGLESTSVLLSLYNGAASGMRQAGAALRGEKLEDEGDAASQAKSAARREERVVVPIPPSSAIWRALRSNATVHAHVLLTRRSSSSSSSSSSSTHKPDDIRQAAQSLRESFSSHDALLGRVSMTKHAAPTHLSKPTRMLGHDLTYLLRKYVLFAVPDSESPPWDTASSKPTEHAAYAASRRMQEDGVGYPYWKPEVAVKFVGDDAVYPVDMVGNSGMEVIQLGGGRSSASASASNARDHPSGYAYLPGLHVDEIGLTSEKYVPLNETVTALPLHVTFDRNDVPVPEDEASSAASASASAGGLSPARWRLLSHFSSALESQKEMGFDDSDIDDVRRLIADTNVALLTVTMLASTLHLLFEFLTFKNDVEFWRGNKDLTGLSVRALFMDFGSQLVILLYLIEKDSSLLMTVPSGVGVLIALWKCQRGAGFRFVRVKGGSGGSGVAFYNRFFRLLGYELHATRLRVAPAKEASDETTQGGGKGGKGSSKGGKETKTHKTTNSTKGATEKVDLVALSIEVDRVATRTLGTYILLPLVLSYTVHSLLVEEHPGWYSWLITSASSAVYALGFVMMTPQLFLNYKLKSVAHLPWRVLGYRFINTFIDDLFAFIIRMPTMARISCFRDDVVFIIYLWQRYLYPVDASRPVEGGGMDAISAAATTEKSAEEQDDDDDKKNK